MPNNTGNRITDNALRADDGKTLIDRAIRDVETRHGWRRLDAKPIFSGIYYDSKKVGSFIARVANDRGERAALKLQLRPLPFDEGMIIRQVQMQIRTPRVRLPNIFFDLPWDETRGYGYLLLEDLSDLPHLWDTRPDDRAFERHENFLREFMHHVLPIEPFFPIPDVSPQDKYREAFGHFHEIAEASRHHHIDHDEIDRMKERYFDAIRRTTFSGFHFTHGHLSGHEILDDQQNDSFILFANLLWSYRPKYYELIFPLWVDLMAIHDASVTVQDLLERIGRWRRLWKNIESTNSTDFDDDPAFWFGLLERSMMTVMLDLGASEWSEEEAREKQALLEAWRNLFFRILEQNV